MANLKITANFITPLLEFNPKMLSFEYSYEKDVPIKKIQKTLHIKNMAELQAIFNPFTVEPFKIISPELKKEDNKFIPLSIAPSEIIDMVIEFDPSISVS